VEKRVKLGSKEYDVHVMEGLDDEDSERKVQVEMTVPEDKLKALIDEYWGMLSKELAGRLNEHERSSKVWLKEIEESVDHRGMLTDNKIEELTSNIDKIRADYRLETGFLKSENNDLVQKV